MRTLILCSSFAILLCGCAALDGKQRELNLMDGGGVSFDISRRAILVGEAPTQENSQGSTEENSEGSTQENSRRVVCAEPSPDAMTTLAASLSASGSLPSGASGELASAFSESGAYIGLRTQSIQLLRDSMFRTCEAYLSGGISGAQYALLLRRHQRYMLALLSIEALTGTVRAPNVTLSTESMASASSSVTRLREQHADIQSERATVETRISAKQAEVDGAEDESDAKARLERELADLQDRLALLDEHKTLIETAIENASGLMASGTTRVEVSNVGVGPVRSDAHIETISQTVADITESLLDMDDFNTLCLIHLLEKGLEHNSAESDGENAANINDLCIFELRETTRTTRLRNDTVEEILDSHENNVHENNVREIVLSFIDLFNADSGHTLAGENPNPITDAETEG